MRIQRRVRCIESSKESSHYEICICSSGSTAFDWFGIHSRLREFRSGSRAITEADDEGSDSEADSKANREHHADDQQGGGSCDRHAIDCKDADEDPDADIT